MTLREYELFMIELEAGQYTDPETEVIFPHQNAGLIYAMTTVYGESHVVTRL